MTLTFKTLNRRRKVFHTVPVTPIGFALLVDGEGRLWPLHRAKARRVVMATMLRAGIAGPMSYTKGLGHSYGMRAADKCVPTKLVQQGMGPGPPTGVYMDAVSIKERRLTTRMWWSQSVNELTIQVGPTSSARR